MKRASRQNPAPAAQPEEMPEADDDLSVPEEGTIIAHPDGFYWVAPDGRQEFGPFASVEDARADMMSSADSNWAPGEALREAEEELGIADWLDPETGGPAEDTHLRFSDD